ncbi:MAG: gliding motility protein GldL [Tannerellaceae bacterium]|jgi:gliding motility-associated protein GldL|nr:gliding motility protein GldL [Tannerellaceae bacterium]
MGKYKIYKNRVEMFFSSNGGKRILNFFYSWGASVVILGALFKILHLPYGNQMLAIGMITEVVVFFIFGFERPSSDYRWEDVFPALSSKNPLDRPDISPSSGSSVAGTGGGINMGGNIHGTATQANNGGGNIPTSGGASGGTYINISGSQAADPNTITITQKMLDAADRISEIPDLAAATQKYMEQIAKISAELEKFSSVTESLSSVSNGINSNSLNYVRQMENLNRNVAGLNTIYELQLKSISSQISSIEHINAGLNRIKDLYEGSIVDSSVFRAETEKMAQQLAQLNTVYARLLQAMTVNMGIPAAQAGQFQPNPSQTK